MSSRLEFYNRLHKEFSSLSVNQGKIVLGDFNARLYEVQPDEALFVGTNILKREGYLTKGIADNTRDNTDTKPRHFQDNAKAIPKMTP